MSRRSGVCGATGPPNPARANHHFVRRSYPPAPDTLTLHLPFVPHRPARFIDGGLHLGTRAIQQFALRPRFFRADGDGFEQGRYTAPIVNARYPLARAKEAYAAVERGNQGRIVLTP